MVVGDETGMDGSARQGPGAPANGHSPSYGQQVAVPRQESTLGSPRGHARTPRPVGPTQCMSTRCVGGGINLFLICRFVLVH